MRWTSLRAGRDVLAAGETSAVPLATKASDLPMRVLSAAVMMAIAIAAVVAGDPWLDGFIALVALATFAEFVRLVVKATAKLPLRILALLLGAVYIGGAGYILAQLPVPMIVGVIGAVIFVDSFAYGFGRTIGGPKIAPRISPSKTWAGLLGGVVGASVWLYFYATHDGCRFLRQPYTWMETGKDAFAFDDACHLNFPFAFPSVLVAGLAIAVAAQSGDFFESWLKRKAGVKDSSNLIPGHGGFFDRTDGIIPVVLLAGLFLNVMQ